MNFEREDAAADELEGKRMTVLPVPFYFPSYLTAESVIHFHAFLNPCTSDPDVL